MIAREEIEAKPEEFDIHISNVEREYAFDWWLAGIYPESCLASALTLKGRRLPRKASFLQYKILNRFETLNQFVRPKAISEAWMKESFLELA